MKQGGRGRHADAARFCVQLALGIGPAGQRVCFTRTAYRGSTAVRGGVAHHHCALVWGEVVECYQPASVQRQGVPPQSIRFKGTLQVQEALQPFIAYHTRRGANHQALLYQEILRAIAVHRVAEHPGRFEPRMAKRRPKRYDRLTKPRQEVKRQMLTRVGGPPPSALSCGCVVPDSAPLSAPDEAGEGSAFACLNCRKCPSQPYTLAINVYEQPMDLRRRSDVASRGDERAILGRQKGF
jgi:hypothetical protein